MCLFNYYFFKKVIYVFLIIKFYLFLKKITLWYLTYYYRFIKWDNSRKVLLQIFSPNYLQAILLSNYIYENCNKVLYSIPVFQHDHRERRGERICAYIKFF